MIYLVNLKKWGGAQAPPAPPGASPLNSNTVAYLSEKFQRIWRLSDNIGGPIFKMPLNEIAVHVDGGYFIQPISTFFFNAKRIEEYISWADILASNSSSGEIFLHQLMTVFAPISSA